MDIFAHVQPETHIHEGNTVHTLLGLDVIIVSLIVIAAVVVLKIVFSSTANNDLD